MDKNQIYEYLNNNNIKYEISEHIAVYNMEEAYDIKLPYPNASAKNLFIRDNKKQNYYLLTVKGDKKVNLKIIYIIFDYPYKHYTFNHFKV